MISSITIIIIIIVIIIIITINKHDINIIVINVIITITYISATQGVSKPLTEGGDQAQVYLPKTAGWYDLHTGAFFAPGHHDLKVSYMNIA